MTWVKICGITNLEDARVAIDAGADALGFVFYHDSPRYLSAQAARRIIENLPEKIVKVAVFADASSEQMSSAARDSKATAAQVFVGVRTSGAADNSSHCFEELTRGDTPLKLIPVVSMQGENPEGQAKMWKPPVVYAFLLESAARAGGTGLQFDWAANQKQAEAIKRLGKVIVAGGLTPTNVGQAMRILKPWGVDVSSGVEAAPGKKDPEKVRAFIAAVRRADREL